MFTQAINADLAKTITTLANKPQIRTDFYMAGGTAWYMVKNYFRRNEKKISEGLLC